MRYFQSFFTDCQKENVFVNYTLLGLLGCLHWPSDKKRGLKMNKIKTMLALGLFIANSMGWDAGNGITVTAGGGSLLKINAGGKIIVDVIQIKLGGIGYTTSSSQVDKGTSFEVALGAKIVTITPVLNGIRIQGNGGTGLTEITINDGNQHYWGLQEQNVGSSPDITGETITHEVMGHWGGEAWARTTSAFFMSSNGYGSFYNTFAEGRYELARGGKTTFFHETPILDWYIFYGPTGDKIHQGYYSVIGKPKYIPMWACGPSYWRDIHSNSDQAVNDVKSYTDNQIPLSFMWVDRPYSNGTRGWGQMDWNGDFSPAATWIGTMNNTYNVEVLTWIAPLTWGDPCDGHCWSGDYSYIDLSSPAGATWYKEKIKSQQHSVGVRGHKMDRGEEALPLAGWADPVTDKEKKFKYLFLNAKVTHEMLTETYGTNQFNFARSSYHGAQPYLSAIWGGDSKISWGGYTGNIQNGIRVSYMGFPMYGSDAGGYGEYNSRVKIPEDRYLRWVTFAQWSGLMEVMIDGRDPWTYSADFISKYKSIHDQRMNLLPYVYSLLNTADRYGVLMRPMSYMHPSDPATYALWDQYEFGPTFLVAAITSANNTRNVYLPQGKWIDHYTGAEHNGGANITATAPIERFPVFVKSNSLYPSGHIFSRGNEKTWLPATDPKRELTINAYPGAAGEGFNFIYVDYQDGDKEKLISLSVDAEQRVHVKMPAMTVAGNVKIRTGQPTRTEVYLNAQPVTDLDYDYTSPWATVKYPANVAVHVQVGGTAVKVAEKPQYLNKDKLNLVRRGNHLLLTGLAEAFANVSQDLHLVVSDVNGKTILSQSIRNLNNVEIKLSTSGIIFVTLLKSGKALWGKKSVY